MAKHHYITCTGFGGTGSSVISDLMKEFENVKSCGDSYELSLAFQIDGIRIYSIISLMTLKEIKLLKQFIDFVK